jgi:4-pyridoxolactonase
VKVYFLDTGSIVIDHSQLLWNVPGDPVRIPSYGVLVEHTDGLFVLDTGFDHEHTQRVLPFELPEQTAEQTIPEQLKLCGFETGDVRTLVNSHLHFDHVGGNKHLTEATVVVHEKELAQARNFEPFERFGYSDTTWDYDGARFETVTGDVELAGGIRLYETPGHSVGHYAVLLTSDGGGKPMLFPFDVVNTAAGLEREIQSSFHIDPVAGLRSLRRVKQLAEERGADVFFPHDMDGWNTYKHAPEFYEL